MSNKKELKIGMAIDDYKLPNKEKWWNQCLTMRPEIERDYDLVREESGKGISPKTTMLYRYYKLKEKP